jgi:hypothetical protein
MSEYHPHKNKLLKHPFNSYIRLHISSSIAQAAYGDTEGNTGSKGMATLDMMVNIASTCLVAYPGEGALHKQVKWAT